MTIEHHSDVRGYFRDRLVTAMKRQRVHTDERTEFYLVNLLASQAIRPSDEAIRTPLIEMLAQASESTGAERLHKFRDVGDSALYVSGFFADHLARRGVNAQYAATLGGRAYSLASSLVSRWAPAAEAAFGDVYGELSEKFDVFVRVFDDVREETALRTPQDIIRLYEKWRQTGSPALAERLEKAGVFPQIQAAKGGRVIH